MRHHLRLRVLLPALASLAAACGGSTDTVDPGSSTSSGGASSSSSGGSSSSSSSSGNASSSSSSSSSSGSPEPVYTLNACTPGKGHELMVGVTLAAGIDFLELRNQPMGQPPPPATAIGSVGTACASAGNKPACTNALASASSEGWNASSGGGFEAPQHRYAVTTKGDTVTIINDPSELGAVVAGVENEKDAAFLVVAKGDNRLPCEANNVAKTATGYSVKVHTGIACGKGSNELERIYAVTTAGVVTLEKETIFKEGTDGCAIGRRPEGLVAQRSGECSDPVGRFFAEAAHLEAASVFSFDRLAAELTSLGAPTDLIDSAHSSREDEVRHARMTSKMAKRFGGQPREPKVEALPARSKLAIALENATEGCVRETYGALVAHRQASAATDDSIRCMMHVIAEDETKHAGLAWDVAAWLEPQLTVDERIIVEDARRRALADLRRELEADVHPDLRTRAGMPDARAALTLLDALDQRFIASA